MEVNVINDATKQQVPIQLVDNEDSTYTVEVTPDSPGTFTTNLTYGGLKVPFNKKTVISSHASVDVSKVQVEGLEQSKYKNPYRATLIANRQEFSFCKVIQSHSGFSFDA